MGGGLMKRHVTPRAVNRARWFAELSAALDEGGRVLAELVAAGVSHAETEGLRLRLIELRSELGRLNKVDFDQDRIIGTGWPHQASAGPL
jgi:hypothetical protein